MGSALFSDGDSANAAKFNQTLAVGAAVTGMYLWCARVKYNGSSWEVDANHSSAGLTTGALAWDGGDDELEITLTDFASRPVVVATPVTADTGLECKAYAESTTKATIRFYNIDTGVLVTTEATTMDVNVMIVGNYVS
jgi:hypothetical protein